MEWNAGGEDNRWGEDGWLEWESGIIGVEGGLGFGKSVKASSEGKAASAGGRALSASGNISPFWRGFGGRSNDIGWAGVRVGDGRSTEFCEGAVS